MKLKHLSALFALSISLASCGENDALVDALEKDNATPQSEIRSIDEAYEIAAQSLTWFDSADSRSSVRLLPSKNEVKVFKSIESRGESSDTLMYVVNFQDEEGFAIVPANRNMPELLAVTESGSYDPASDSEVEPFNEYMKNAISVLSNGSHELQPVDTLREYFMEHKEENTYSVLYKNGPKVPYKWGQTGFEGMLNNHIPDNVALTAEEKELAEKMIAEINKFTKNNRIADNVEIEPETREFLNSILKGIPEFAAYFGKPQHSLQKYSLDVHILKVMQDSMKDPLYKELGDVDKLVLKFTTLLHDVGKRYLLEGSDTGHAAMSAEYVYSILDRFNLTQDVKNRIIANIENHHWFKEYNLGHIRPETVAALCRRPEDFKIYQIMAKADLKNVNDTFYMRALGVSSMEDADIKFAEKMAEIAPYVQILQEKQVVVTPTTFRDVPQRVASDGRVVAP